ncbi:tetratricopeptide repeat protein [Klebsiella aerogenes]|uniref:tetratricopeptide repeat protein n=1 Tax=Klebsiella aerogenes TaxID=548 RepID=UPI002D811212|nr:hypothetical protein [Klebsiella aerogenes]
MSTIFAAICCGKQKRLCCNLHINDRDRYMSGRFLCRKISLLMMLSIWLVGCNTTPISKIALKAGDSRILLRGELPAKTTLQINASYVSTHCSHRELVFSGGDITEPQWRTRNSWSYINKTVPAMAEKQSYLMELPVNEMGKCRWRLDKLKMTFTLSASERQPTANDHLYYVYSFNHEERASEPDALTFTPTIYPLAVEREHNNEITKETFLASSDRKAAEWFSAYEVKSALNFAHIKHLTINVSPTMDVSYRVNIASRLDTDPKAWTKKYRATVTYPDGTTYFYTRDPDAPVPDGAIAWRDNASTMLYSPDAPESHLATLTRSGAPQVKRLLAEIYQLGHAVPQDKEKARRLYQQAALGGDVPAMLWMKQQAQYARDKQQIQRWNSRLAQAGDATAQFDLAWRDVCWKRDTKNAEAMLRHLADNGDASAVKFLTFWQNMNADERQQWQQVCRSH